MSNARIRSEDFKIPSRPQELEQLREIVSGPQDIEGATKQLGLAPHLLNLHLATIIDVSYLGLGRTLYIPVQIADRDGGRKSLYFLDVDEEVLAGVYIKDLGILRRYVKRTSGTGTPAQSGDMYSERLVNPEGKTLFEADGPLEVIDSNKGHGSVRLQLPDSDVEARSMQWLFWSMIYYEHIS